MRHADLGARLFLLGNLFRRPPAGASPSLPPCRLVERLETEDPSEPAAEPAACPAPALESRRVGCPAECAGHLLWIRSAFVSRQRSEHLATCPQKTILPQILGSLPEVIRSWCEHHHHHHHHHTRSSRGRFEWSARFHRPSRRVAGPGKRHSARGTPRAQPRDVRSAGRDTWNLTGEALGGPRKRSWRRCSRARSGRRSAIRGAHSGAFDRP